jgi:hypothetical protein
MEDPQFLSRVIIKSHKNYVIDFRHIGDGNVVHYVIHGTICKTYVEISVAKYFVAHIEELLGFSPF